MTTPYVRAKNLGQFSLKPMKPSPGDVLTARGSRPILGQGQQIALRDGRANAATLRGVGR